MIIHTYTNKIGGMGLGDFIRGSIACKQLCEDFDLKFEMNFNNHSIGKYLCDKTVNQVCKTNNKIYDLENIIDPTIRGLKRELSTITKLRNLKRENLFIYTNVWPNFKTMRKSIVTDVKQFLQPTIECENTIATALGDLTDYEVIHIRAGDAIAFNTQIREIVDHSLEQVLDSLSDIQQITESSNRQCIIMSDSFQCKKLCGEKYNLPFTSSVPAHMALDSESVLDTLVDFFILSRAKKIHQFSVHYWGSGFSDSVNWLYKVPVIKYKMIGM